MRQFVKFFATGCYAGKAPYAPGTAGAAVGVLFYFLIGSLPHYLYAITTVAFIFFAAWISTEAQKIYNEQDPQEVVIDEIAGMLVTMAFHKFDIFMALGGFVLFRVFDIAKPFPLHWVERRFRSGWGVVLDDVSAGIYANIALWFVGLLIPNW